MELCGLQRAVQDWALELNQTVKKLKGRSFISIFLRVAWRAFVYFMWRERNQRIYSQRAKTISCLLEQIKSIVRLKLSRLHNIVEDLVNRSLCKCWGLNIFDKCGFLVEVLTCILIVVHQIASKYWMYWLQQVSSFLNK